MATSPPPRSELRGTSLTRAGHRQVGGDQKDNLTGMQGAAAPPATPTPAFPAAAAARITPRRPGPGRPEGPATSAEQRAARLGAPRPVVRSAAARPLAVGPGLLEAGQASWRRRHLNWALANLKSVFLESQADVGWENEGPQRAEEDWFQLYFPENDLHLQTGQ